MILSGGGERRRMDDTISRQAAIDEIEYELEMINSALDSITLDFNTRERLRQRRGEAREILNYIQQLPPAQPEQRWTPCTPETMPKKTDYYLVQYTRKYCRDEMAVAFYSVEEARCDDDYTWEIETFSDIKEVIAWMHLPEPYRVDEEGDE